METSINLRVGVHIEQSTTLTNVQAMLSQAGHHCLTDNADMHSLTAYLETVIAQIQQASSSPYDLLILGTADAIAFTDTQMARMLMRLLALQPLPILVLTNASRAQLPVWRQFPVVAVLPEDPLSMPLFFQTLGRLTQRCFDAFNSAVDHTPPNVSEQNERVIEAERKRIAIRHSWLEQRQEWLNQRRAWLEQRQAWVEERRKDQDPQREWLSEQRAWLDQQRSEVDSQQKNLNDLRRWLAIYQSRVDDERPPFLHEAR